MKKFVLITVGFTQPTPGIMEKWVLWFKSIEDKIVEQVGLMSGREVTSNSIKDLPMDDSANTGYLVIEAENIDEATDIAKKCPMVTSTLIYEQRSQN